MEPRTCLKRTPTLRSQVPPVTGAPALAWSTPSRPWPAPQEGTMEEAATTVTTTTRSRWQSSWNNSGKSRKKSKSTHEINNRKRSELRNHIYSPLKRFWMNFSIIPGWWTNPINIKTNHTQFMKWLKKRDYLPGCTGFTAKSYLQVADCPFSSNCDPSSSPCP